MGGQKKIEAYLDCVSPYTFYAFLFLQKNREALKAHGVEVEYFPFFLGGVNQATGNKPPWTVPAKGAYGNFDMERAQKFFGIKHNVPSFFPMLSLLPLRCLTYTKRAHPSTYEEFFGACFSSTWLEEKDLSKPDEMYLTCRKVYDEATTQEILKAATTPEIKKELNETTRHAWEDLGAFGSPWFWVSDGKGKHEPFFGSDRFHYMWNYLGLPHDTSLDLQMPIAGKL